MSLDLSRQRRASCGEVVFADNVEIDDAPAGWAVQLVVDKGLEESSVVSVLRGCSEGGQSGDGEAVTSVKATLEENARSVLDANEDGSFGSLVQDRKISG